MPSYCAVTVECVAVGRRRACGHVACDGHTDAATDICMWCVPVFEDDYAAAVDRNVEMELHGD